jgi:hypothetical protein
MNQTSTLTIENPLLGIWERVWGIDWKTGVNLPWMEKLDLENKAWGLSGGDMMSHYRDKRRHTYSWAVPTPEALELIASYAPIVEIGAGSGYWASILRDMGVKIRAYDRHPLSGQVENHWHMYGNPTPWTNVAKGGPSKAGRYADHALFLCWPPMSSMAHDSFKNYMEAGGETLIYVGEGMGGCTADDNFHILTEEWHVEKTVNIPQWAGIHDYLSVYKRR